MVRMTNALPSWFFAICLTTTSVQVCLVMVLCLFEIQPHFGCMVMSESVMELALQQSIPSGED